MDLIIGIVVFSLGLASVIILLMRNKKNKKVESSFETVTMDYQQLDEMTPLQDVSDVPMSNVDNFTKDKVYDFTNPEEYNYLEAVKQQNVTNESMQVNNAMPTNNESVVNQTPSQAVKGNNFAIPDQFVGTMQNIYEERTSKDCPKCGNKVDSKSEYCFLCGHKFE